MSTPRLAGGQSSHLWISVAGPASCFMSGRERCLPPPTFFFFFHHKLPPDSACPPAHPRAGLAGFITTKQHLTWRIYSGGLRFALLCGSAQKGVVTSLTANKCVFSVASKELEHHIHGCFFFLMLYNKLHMLIAVLCGRCGKR